MRLETPMPKYVPKSRSEVIYRIICKIDIALLLNSPPLSTVEVMRVHDQFLRFVLPRQNNRDYLKRIRSIYVPASLTSLAH